MRLVDYLDKGASLGPDRPCLTTDGWSMSYAEVVELSSRIAASLAGCGVCPGDKVAILSANDPIAFSCVFGISRAGAVWCPINPRNEAAENRELLDLFDCVALIFQSSFAPLVSSIKAELPKLTTLVCLDRALGWAYRWQDFLALGTSATPNEPDEVIQPIDDVAMIVGTGGTTGRPKGVVLTGANLEAMTALTLIGYPFDGRPVYLALAPLTHAAGVLCFPVLALGGEVVIMRAPDVGEFLTLVEEHEVTHTFLPPTLIYMVLGHPSLDSADLSSLQCFWYGAAPMSASRLEEALTRIGPVMAQLFGQTEAPMMISMLPPADHFRPDGSIHTERLSSAGRPAPLVTVAILDPAGGEAAAGERGEIGVRGSLVMAGYYKNPEATAEVSRARVAPHRRHRLSRRGRLPVHRRPREGHDHHRRLQRLLDGGRAGAHAAPRRPGLRGRRPARRQVGRARGRRTPAASRPIGRPRRTHRLRQVADRQRQGPQADRGVARPPPLEGGQGPEDRDQGQTDQLRPRLERVAAWLTEPLSSWRLGS